jgi:large subunit ribosomal protein L7e
LKNLKERRDKEKKQRVE